MSCISFVFFVFRFSVCSVPPSQTCHCVHTISGRSISHSSQGVPATFGPRAPLPAIINCQIQSPRSPTRMHINQPNKSKLELLTPAHTTHNTNAIQLKFSFQQVEISWSWRPQQCNILLPECSLPVQ